MIKSFYISSAIILIFAISLHGCKRGDKSIAAAAGKEVLPEDIVELRQDQIKLADIELGNIEIRSMGNILKVNGIVTVAPKLLVIR